MSTEWMDPSPRKSWLRTTRDERCSRITSSESIEPPLSALRCVVLRSRTSTASWRDSHRMSHSMPLLAQKAAAWSTPRCAAPIISRMLSRSGSWEGMHCTRSTRRVLSGLFSPRSSTPQRTACSTQSARKSTTAGVATPPSAFSRRKSWVGNSCSPPWSSWRARSSSTGEVGGGMAEGFSSFFFFRFFPPPPLLRERDDADGVCWREGGAAASSSVSGALGGASDAA
mmetsp:Transcript_39828/g.127354  ORF Transcript_39828/g.127354 Transcript_39828/m.127354 type:complete len:227 (+) Transcript_39828:1430-2110(+)